jgi:XTP/dITP diphosphohydrolase
MPPSSALVPTRATRSASGSATRSPLIVATGNPGKLREFRALLADFPFDLHSLAELGIASPEESGSTFLENAMLKATHAAAAAAAAGIDGASRGSVAALADDSGLEVDALGGAPGIFSARYAGEGAGDAANNTKLITALAGIPAERRGARYRCVLVLVPGEADAAPWVAEGVWEGTILDSPRGTGGFGYDPYFFLADRRQTAAQLDPEEKNRLSHRGIAMRALRDQLLARAQFAARDQLPAGRRP